MVHKSLILGLVFAAILAAFQPCSIRAAGGPAVLRIDKTITVLLFQRELYLEIRQSPVSERKTAMSDYIDAAFQNNAAYLKTKGFRSTTPVYRYPWSTLSCRGKVLVVKALFPEDSLTTRGWEHTVTYGGSHGETLWRIGLWFTGSGANGNAIARKNGIDPRKLAVGSTIIVDTSMLDPCFRNSERYPVEVGDLMYRLDKYGVFAEYRLLSGQTIYSQVLRFTPRVTAVEVMEASEAILKRSGLRDFHTIPANFSLKIPADLVSPQFLPPNHPRRIQFESTDRESSKFKPNQKAKLLRGITIILDAGHGGVDPGAMGRGGVKEDEYAYDVMCRVKRILERETEATVFVTIKDDETGFEPRAEKLLGSGRNREKILTNPSYSIEDVGVALNLRWFLTNYIFDTKCNSKTRDEKVVFTSFHADSLHPSASGLMVYIPGADYYTGSIRKTASVYTRRREVKHRNSVSTSRSERLKAEGFSRAFAQRIEQQCETMGLKMHSEQPTRKFVIRRGRSWVPAILRYCQVPTRVLVELANLQNSGDVKRIKDEEFRETLARMYVEALKNHFSESAS